MKVILDTNGVLSGIFLPGPPHQILKAWREGQFSLILSHEIYEEYVRTARILAKEHPPVDIRAILDLIKHGSDFHDAPALPEQICADPADDKFLACALASGTKLIVSGDKHLLVVSEFRGIKVLRPKDFLEMYIK